MLIPLPAWLRGATAWMLALLTSLSASGQFSTLQASLRRQHFVERVGGGLVLNGRPFRAAGVNIYWLGLDQNVGGVAYPSHFRVTDALDTAQLLGANVIRAHTLGVSTGRDLSVEPQLGRFNDAAFAAIDFAIAEAGKRNLKLVIPLTDNYAYYHGGRHNFTDWRQLPVESFYTDPHVIADFEAYVEHLLMHKSAITGIALRDDDTIMAWETGNEIRPPSAWTSIIAAFIKSKDRKHLVLDGHYGVDPASLQNPDVDLVGAHFNGTSYKMTGSAEREQTSRAEGKKPFFIGEFDWRNHHKSGDLDGFLQSISGDRSVAGVVLWSLFAHRDDFGFVEHNDGFTMHYPGDDADMREREAKLISFFNRFTAAATQRPFAPGAPAITSFTPSRISWRGTAGAATYELQQSRKSASGPWLTLSSDLTDVAGGFDIQQPPAKAWYRIRGRSLTGKPGPYSPVVPLECSACVQVQTLP